ncbi:hypothetical protein ACH4MN_28425 [Streptomyces anulatus]|uniref:hypothetical protein n=1 Tax=unclassified Streptomyces TaxID=2593676 RepID=UPI000851CD35|nr:MULTISPECIES: hypothetical protein [unclassified Streptomyces]
MTRMRASVSAFAHPRRGLVAAALAVLALTGCGSEVRGGGQRTEPDVRAGSTTSAARPTPEQAAFAAMLDRFAQPCPSPGGAAPGSAGEKRTGPEPVQSLAPGETPPAEPIEPGPLTGPAAELNARDWCTSAHHEQRVIEALQSVPEPTPAKVRATLNSLGYIDAHIHGLQQDGKATRFYLDLRESGGRLCVAGLAAGEVTDANACVAAAEGPFTVTTEERL